jgi:tetratricopeptide (TPR) repeat protein
MKAAVAAAGALIALAGCTTHSSVMPAGHVVELDDVPFFAQERYQCGPAALATILVNSGVTVTPEELVSMVYVPERKGSFQPEIKAAARRYERLPYELAPDAQSLFAEIDAGNPVLILQNLFIDRWPRWHYAVVVGYDSERGRILLRSGKQERRVESINSFLRNWRGGKYWAIIALRPGQIPASATAERYVEMIADSEGLVSASARALALESGLQEWPDNANLAFIAANQARGQGKVVEAASLYQQALQSQPDHLGALNNYSDLLLSESCLSAARVHIETARRLVDTRSAVYPVILSTANAIEASGQMHDVGSQCEKLTAYGTADGLRKN